MGVEGLTVGADRRDLWNRWHGGQVVEGGELRGATCSLLTLNRRGSCECRKGGDDNSRELHGVGKGRWIYSVSDWFGARGGGDEQEMLLEGRLGAFMYLRVYQRL